MTRRKWTWYHSDSGTQSCNAEIAEEQGRLPLLRAIDEVYQRYDCKRHGITKKAIRRFLEANHDGEWHHVGGYAMRVDYHRTRLTFGELRRLVKKARRGEVKNETTTGKLPIFSDEEFLRVLAEMG
jgi:hypothetical protein